MKFETEKPSEFTDQFWLVASLDLVEDVVAPLFRQLEGHPRLLQQICVGLCDTREECLRVSDEHKW